MSADSGSNPDEFEWQWSNLPDTKILRYKEVEGSAKVGEFDVYKPNEETLGFGAKIVAVPDKNRGRVYLPWMYKPVNDDYIQYLAKRNGREDITFTQEQEDRLRYCFRVLKLPPLAAVDLTFNRPETDLGGYVVPGKDAVIPLMVSLTGEPGSGKSLFGAMLAIKLNAPVMNFDTVSMSWSIEAYLKSLKAEGFGEGAKTLEMAQYLVQQRQANSTKELVKGQMLPMKEILPASDTILRSGDRPPVIICDMPGDRESRPRDVLDAAGHHSFAQTYRLADFRRPEDFASVIKEYLQECPKALSWARGLQNRFAASV